MFLIIFVLQCYSWCKGVWLFLLIFTARDFFLNMNFSLSLLCHDVHYRIT